MKKGALLITLILSLILIPFIIAVEEVEEKGYTCLRDKLDNLDCERRGFEEQTLALLTLGKCEKYVKDQTEYNNIKLVSRALLALEGVGSDDSSVNNASDWLWSNTKTPTDFQWYLQIDSTEATTCDITYDGTTDVVSINEDKTLNETESTLNENCLSINGGNYWLKIKKDSTCYDSEFEIRCNTQNDFLTNLLFTSGDGTIHVSADSHTSSSVTNEKINIKCFGTNGCDYEGTLWATLVLQSIGYTNQDLDPFIFYLKTHMEGNEEYLPESFLYYLTTDSNFMSDLIGKQDRQEGSWDISRSSNKYYDTAIALLSFPTGGAEFVQYSAQLNKAIFWLTREQGEDGCWHGGNFKDTALILFSIWPREVSLPPINILGGDGVTPPTGDGTVTPSENGISVSPSEDIDCVAQGYFCMSGIACEGLTLGQYECNGFNKCCSQELTLETCQDLNGETCNSNQQCVGGSSENTYELDYGQTCCIGGACEISTTISGEEEFTCESSGDICRLNGCREGEDESFNTCEYGDTCCTSGALAKEKSSMGLWILVLSILIILIVVGIIKKDKLREFWFRAKSKFTKPTGPPRPGRRPMRGPPMPPQRRMMQGRAPPHRRPSQIIRPASKAPGEINNVLKKLKDMGK